jgi:hypothetical protein
MHAGDRVPIVVAHFVNEIVAGDPGIIDENIERAEAQRHLLDHMFDLVGDRDIRPDSDRLDPAAHGDADGGCFGGVEIEVAQRHRYAILGEPLGGRRADAPRPAGDKRHPAL